MERAMNGNNTLQMEITAQKRAIARLKREIFGIDKTYKSKYIREFMAEHRAFQEIVPLGHVIDEAAAADVVYFGDYHPLDASQDLVLRLMRELTSRARPVVLALEMLYTRQQPSLDRWMKGTITEGEFLSEIEYKSEWGFNWESYRRIFMLAKNPFIPIFGIDEEPRDQLTFIRSRDRLIARRIMTIRRFFPGHLVLVVVGESHLASNHLPAGVRAFCGEPYREVIVVQNIEEIYWQLLGSGKETADAVRIDRTRYCIFNTSPILKYESYREIIDAWSGDGTSDRWTPVLEKMVDDILLFLVRDRCELCVTVRDGLQETIDDVFPEVYCCTTYKAFATLLRSKRMSQLGTFAIIEYLRQCGIAYVPAVNAFLVMRFESVHPLREAARFVVWATRDRVGKERGTDRDPADRFYEFVLEEALLYLATKFVNPKQDCLETDPVLRCIDSRGVVRCALPRLSMSDTRKIVRMVKYHFRRDRKTDVRFPVTRKLEAIYRLGIKRRWFAVRTLGHTLGDAIYTAYHAGQVTRDEIIELFRERFEAPGSARGRYLAFVRRTSPYRGHRGSYRSASMPPR